MSKQPCVYIMASKRNGTLYTGVTSNLQQRAFQHRSSSLEGFAKKYGCTRLVWYEPYERMDEAIAREKQIKGGNRIAKLALIEAMNRDWIDSTKHLLDRSDSTAPSRKFVIASDSEATQAKGPGAEATANQTERPSPESGLLRFARNDVPEHWR